MVHLLLFRSCKNYVYSDKASYGTHQVIERNISKRKYKVNAVREGYNTPFATEWRIIEYRLKKEIVPEFVKDLQCVNLNPTPNNITLYNIIRSNPPNYHTESVGKLFLIIQWIFKWINKKKTTFFILLIISILTFQYWLLLLGIIILINPIKPVPISEGEIINNFRNGNWSYDIVFGLLNDSGEGMKDPYSDETYFQEDIL